LDSELLHTYAYTNEIRAEYLEKLIKFSPKNFEKAFLLSAGTETTEAALKLMRMNGQKNYSKKKIGIICFEGNWHGRTMGAQMMGGNIGQKEWIGYQDPNIFHIRFPYPWILEKEKISSEKFLEKELTNLIINKKISLKDNICGFMLETFQGWGAVFYPKEFVQLIKKICLDNNILLCFDEMQAGFGRTGEKYGFEHYGVEADIICCGKGMGSGLPLSAVLSSKEIMDLPSVGNMSSTHSANPLVCAAGLATLEYMENENLIQRSKKIGEKFHFRLNEIQKKFPKILYRIEGKGMIAAMIFNQDNVNIGSEIASKISWECFKRGVFVVHTGRESIKLGPPLIISEEALNESLDVIEDILKEINNEY
jgi:4-aminobutyrate aminotransferase-like enzyme